MTFDDNKPFFDSLPALTGWVEGQQQVASGVTFTFTYRGDKNSSAPRWDAGALAERVYVARPQQGTGVDFRVDGCRHVGLQSLGRALSNAVKWKVHRVARARRMLAEYDAAELAVRVRGMAAAAEATFNVPGLSRAVDIIVEKGRKHG